MVIMTNNEYWEKNNKLILLKYSEEILQNKLMLMFLYLCLDLIYLIQNVDYHLSFFSGFSRTMELYASNAATIDIHMR